MSIKQRTKLISVVRDLSQANWAITLIEQGEGISTKHFAFYQQLLSIAFYQQLMFAKQLRYGHTATKF
ncbi:hypothetical protein [Paraglaciecola psychrophila]|jgi:predicted signal transduction protein with EAL and GGDEF domain|uniref:Uncharacterized protein n=1 Tax=Paraglaciecola psychrophila 170 TaxID=1129794 RepID=K7AB79_9ALTE|nr:hypothetical protein [Paraglaciecola psychrophila]AGH44390.1 hypothetical protein C427_2281 [Paraglaciecola psychrophila 170]GAC37948.1 hypothetical protein GPSY_2327 [Paraglaciecola psychrophila 170]